MRLLTVALITATTLVACEVDQVACTASIEYSVTVELVDAAGQPIDGALVTYTVDGGAEQDCEDFSNGTYACGEEEAGRIEVTAEVDGEVQTASFDITADECHVNGQSATLSFDG